MKRRGLMVLSVVAAAALTLSLAACTNGNDNSEEKAVTSELYGTFTFQETKGADIRDAALVATNDVNKVASGAKEYLYVSTFPLNNIGSEQPISYNMDQRIKLNRDFTYKYDYTILLSNPNSWADR